MRNLRAGAALIGREEAHAALQNAASNPSGQDIVLLVAGEAGVGKTALVEFTLAHSDLLLLTGAAFDGLTMPYGPLVTALRTAQQHLNDPPTAAIVARAVTFLAPEGTAQACVNSGALFDALRAALAAIAQRQPVALFLDDLQWADSATLDVLPALSSALAHESLLVIGAYRHDEVPRDHAIRRMRNALRRGGRLHEISLAPLDHAQTAELIEQTLGAPSSPKLTNAIFSRTEGLPFFVEEMSLALLQGEQLAEDVTGFSLRENQPAGLPVPESVRDAVHVRTGALSQAARGALEVCAVAGLECAIDLITALGGDDCGVAELMGCGLLTEHAPGRAVFRHALVRDACYADIPWPRRRALHRDVAAYLEEAAAPAAFVAEHWLAGHDAAHAIPALLAAADASCTVHAYRDAARLYQRALELWPRQAQADTTGRFDVLERLGHCAELGGDLVKARTSWLEVAELGRQANLTQYVATAEHLLAGLYERQGQWDLALEARDSAAAAFAVCGDPGEAAAERLMAATHLRSAASFHAALAMLDIAGEDARRSGRLDLQARILGLEGNVRARLGQSEKGLALVRAGLALALEHHLTEAATDIYQRLADTLEHAGDYPGALTAYDTAAEFCQTHEAPTTARLCQACLTVVLRLTGDWERGMAVSRAVLASTVTSPHARAVAAGVLGSLHILRGQARPARPLLLEAAALSRRIELAAMEIDSAWNLAMVDAFTGDRASALARCRALIARWERTEERHYAVTALRWAVTFCAEHDGPDDARACAAALARIATASGQPEALSALAHALGEVALLDGDALAAASQFDQALTLLQGRPLPFERAHSARRAGIALVVAGERDAGIDRLVRAYRTARHLGARPLAAQITQDLAGQGEPVERRQSHRTSGNIQHGGLSRRELEVLRLVTTGQTSREIAAALFLSPRTVEMHVEHLLAKLDCRTRAEAVRKASALGLLP